MQVNLTQSKRYKKLTQMNLFIYYTIVHTVERS